MWASWLRGPERGHAGEDDEAEAPGGTGGDGVDPGDAQGNEGECGEQPEQEIGTSDGEDEGKHGYREWWS